MLPSHCPYHLENGGENGGDGIKNIEKLLSVVPSEPTYREDHDFACPPSASLTL